MFRVTASSKKFQTDRSKKEEKKIPLIKFSLNEKILYTQKCRSEIPNCYITSTNWMHNG
jgi:hypothetical protein